MSRKYPEIPVLLVDNEEHFLTSTKATLRLHGVTNVDCCQDSRELMPLLEEKGFSLILLDLIMPHIGGEKLMPEIVEKYPNLKVIILTADDVQPTPVKYYKEKGAFDYISKSFEIHQLIDIIRRAFKEPVSEYGQKD